MKDTDLADEIIARLNKLIEEEGVRVDVGRLIETRLSGISDATFRHKSIQAAAGLGFLSLLNGLVGAITEGPREGWGYISAEFDDDESLVRFSRTINDGKQP
jgi:hypothetical protein